MRVPLLIVAISTGIVAAIIAGPWALMYLALYVLATAPGWPLGRILFGRHPASWVSGALLGYGLTCIAFWIALRLHVASAAAFVISWVATCAVTFGAARLPFASTPRARDEGMVPLPRLNAADARTLILLLLLVPAVFVFPYRHIGARDAEGNRLYRAYFTADFIWHMALTSELTKYSMPPVNPYLGDRTIQYYWTYFLVPAVISEEGPKGLQDVERSLKVNALASGVLFTAALVLATWVASRSAVATAWAVVLAVLAASAEGLYAWWEIVSRGAPLSNLTNLNIDAMSNWRYSGLRVDGLVRSMWYNPQHSMAAALGLLVFPIAGIGGANAPMGAVALAGLALALATTFNPLIGALFALIYGVVVIADALRTRAIVPIFRHAAAALLVAVAVVWCVANAMVEGASTVVLYGLGGSAQNRPIATLMLSLGPLLVPGALALIPPHRLPRQAWPALVGAVLGLAVFYFVRLSVDSAYMGFRGGQLLQLALAGLAALLFARADAAGGWMRSAGFALAVALIAIGLPTTLIDTYNAQDVANRRMGPGFHWTIALTPDEQDAFDWIRTQTPRTAVVQMDPVAHGRETWSEVPTFAQRRMAAGRPISLMNISEYAERSGRVHELYATATAEGAATIARELGIDFVFVGPAEYETVGRETLGKFDQRPDLYRLAFSNSRVRIYEVLRP